jgi:hypothetical protein
MTPKKISVGDRIDARCTKCKKIMNHTIVAMVDSRPVRVMCNTCQGQHNYKDPNGPKKPKSSARQSPKPTKAQDAKRQEWENRCQALANAEVHDYAMNTEYQADTLINHPSFGLGVVEQICGGRKIRVLFADGEKILRCK